VELPEVPEHLVVTIRMVMTAMLQATAAAVVERQLCRVATAVLVAETRAQTAAQNLAATEQMVVTAPVQTEAKIMVARTAAETAVLQTFKVAMQAQAAAEAAFSAAAADLAHKPMTQAAAAAEAE